MKRVDDQFVRNFLFGLPPLSGQRAIAAFLDREAARIDEVTRHNTAIAAILAERRTSTIYSTLIPEPRHQDMLRFRHAPTLRLRHCIVSLDQGWSPVCENRAVEGEGSEWGVLKVGCVNGGLFRPEENKALSADMVPQPELEVRRGDVLISRGNTIDLVGSAAYVATAAPRLMISDLLYRLRVDPRKIDPQYLALYLASPPARFQLERAAQGSSGSMPKISQATLRELLIPVPDLPIQREMVMRLEHVFAASDAATERISRQVQALCEHRQALITAAVTGRIDTR